MLKTRMSLGPDRVTERVACFTILTGVLTLGFWTTLTGLVRYALSYDLYSHVLLVPVISGYLMVQRLRKQTSRPDLTTSIGPALLLVLIAGGVWLWAGPLRESYLWLNANDRLAVMTAVFLTILCGSVFLCFGRHVFRALLFPLLFLMFMIPMPTLLTTWVDTGLQHATAACLNALLPLTGTPFFRDGFVFSLPGLTLEIAPECSGIRSTLVLLMTSLLAGYMFLNRSWTRSLLAAAVLPIAAMRNALRIATIGLLTVYVNPDVIKGPVHRQGGPPFFVLSLIPLFLLLLLFRSIERPAKAGVVNTDTTPRDGENEANMSP